MNADPNAHLKRVQKRNNFILGHFVHVWYDDLSDDTLYRHILNLQHFADYHLTRSAETGRPCSVDQLTAEAVYQFIVEDLPRHSASVSPRQVKSYLASFKKFVQFMGEQGCLERRTIADTLQMLKEDCEEMIRAAVAYDEPADAGPERPCRRG